MAAPWQHIDVETRGDVRYVRLLHARFEEAQFDELADELVAAGGDQSCTTVILSLGPQPPECLYSIFLGKLISVQRRLNEKGRKLLLSDAGPEVMAIFSSVRLVEHFTFVDSLDKATP